MEGGDDEEDRRIDPCPRQISATDLRIPAFERVPRLTRGPSPSRAMDSSADFPRAEKRRRHCWRERVGNAGASFVWRRLPPPGHSKEPSY